MSTRRDPLGGPVGRTPIRFSVAVGVPLAVVALGSALWSFGDRFVYVGPLDRAAFGWVVVLPAWVTAAVAAGFAWGQLTPRGGILAALLVGSTIGAVAAALSWQAVASPGCQFGAIQAPSDRVLPSLMLGLVIGGGMAGSGLLASRFVRQGRPAIGAVLGAGAEVAMVFVAVLVAAFLWLGPTCQRPPAG